MTPRELFYKQRERLYAQVNWNSRESIHHYNETVRELRKQMEQEEEKRKENNHDQF